MAATRNPLAQAGAGGKAGWYAMAERQLEKAAIVPDETRPGFRLVLSWMTGGSGRQAEMLPDLFETRAEAEARCRADHGVAPKTPDDGVERRP